MKRIVITLLALVITLGAMPATASACFPDDPGYPTLC